MKLSDHFDSDEFGKCLSDQDLQNYHLLCLLLLESVRARFGVIKVTSGKRDAATNVAVGGVDKSQHTRGEACDFWCPYAPGGMGAVYSFICHELKWPGEVFWYKKRGHIHVALPRYDVKEDHLIFDK